MTVKIARRGVVVPTEYGPDVLDQTRVGDCATRDVVALDGEDSLGAVRAWLDGDAAGSHHQGFPVVDAAGDVLGVLTRREIEAGPGESDPAIASLLVRAPAVVSEDATMRRAVVLMASEDVGRLPVVEPGTRKLVGMLTRSDLLKVYKRRFEQEKRMQRFISLKVVKLGRLPRLPRPPRPPRAVS
jgi:CBS domain-containing protein